MLCHHATPYIIEEIIQEVCVWTYAGLPEPRGPGRRHRPEKNLADAKNAVLFSVIFVI